MKPTELIPIALALFLSGCGFWSTDAPKPNFQVLLVAANLSDSLAQGVPFPDPLGGPKTDLSQIARVIVNLERIELVGEGGRVVGLAPNPELGDSDGDGRPDIDLMTLSGQPTPLVKGTVPAGVYTQFRLFSPLEQGAEAQSVYLVMKSGSKVPLRIPSGQQTGLKLVIQGGFKVQIDATTTLTLAFDLGHSLVQTGNGRYMLKPVVKASGDVSSAMVKGKVTFKGGRAVQDAGVEAKSADNTHLTLTNADGLYSFPTVAAPATYAFTFRLQTPENVVYLSKKTLDVPANTVTTVDAEFEPTGGITVSLKSATPPSDVTVEIKDASQATVASSQEADAQGQYVFSTLPPGLYSVRVGATLGGTPVSGQAAGVVVEDFRMTRLEIELR